MYKNYKDDPSTLVPEDQFMMKVKWQKWLRSQGLYIPGSRKYPRNELVPLFQEHSTTVFRKKKNCSEKQILPRIFYLLRTAKNFWRTVPFMFNFRTLSNKFPTILWSLIFHISLLRSGYFSKKKKKKRKRKIFEVRNVMDWRIRKILTFAIFGEIILKPLWFQKKRLKFP